jgi:1,4-alpha-glucan branching enzyme
MKISSERKAPVSVQNRVLNVCLVVGRINVIGGIQTHVAALAHHLYRKDVGVTVLATDTISRFEPGIHYRRICTSKKHNRVFYPLNLPLHSLGVMVALMKINQEHSVDLIHVHSDFMFPGAWFFAFLFKKPIVYTSHAFLAARTETSPHSSLKNMTIKSIRRFIIKSASAVICVGTDMKNLLSAFSETNTNLHVIPNFIEADFARNSRLRPECANASRYSCLFVGRLVKIKGVEHLIKGIPYVLKNYPQAKFTIVGEGPQRRKLEGLGKELNIESSLIFAGGIHRGSLSPWYENARLLILPSLEEAQSIVALEAFAHGIPVIASRVGGIPEIVREGWNGYLVEPGNEQKIADCICRIFSDDELRNTLSANARKTAEERSWENGIDRFLDLYKTLLK